MLKKTLKLAGLGVLIGITVCNIITIAVSNDVPVTASLIERAGSMKAAFIIQTVLTGIYGALCMGTTVLYDAEKLPLAAASLIHCVICVCPFVPLSLFLGWSAGAVEVFIAAAMQTAGYFLIWLIIYLRYKKEIKDLNEMNELQKQPEKNKRTEDYV